MIFLLQNLALWSSAFLIINWAFGIGFVPRPITLADQIFLYGIASVFSIVVPPMIVFDWPRDRPMIYQVVLVFAIWVWAAYQIIYMCVEFLFCIRGEGALFL